ncbi:MAG: AAA family ATPase [Bryobacteraceae bacterium]
MFSDRIVVLARDLEAASEVRDLLARSHPFHEIAIVDTAAADWLEPFLQSVRKEKPFVALVEIKTFQEIGEVLEPLRKAEPLLPVLVFTRRVDNHVHLELHRMGLADRTLHLPSTVEAVKRLVEGLSRRAAGPLPPSPVLAPMASFFPAKPGSGASTLAWHFANIAAEVLGADVALVDLDLNCGVQSLFGAVQTGINLFDAISVVDHSGRLPEAPHIPQHGRVHIFAALRRCRSVRIDSSLFGNFLQAVRRNYALVVADHSGNWERFSVEVMQSSSAVYCVTAGDYLSLTQANLARPLMEDAGILPCVRLVLNRNGSRFSMPPEQAERLAGLKLASCLPNCFGELQRAIPKNHLAPEHSAYSEAAARLAADFLRLTGKLRSEQVEQLWNPNVSAFSLLAALGFQRRPKSPPLPHVLTRT